MQLINFFLYLMSTIKMQRSTQSSPCLLIEDFGSLIIQFDIVVNMILQKQF
jgi:hypothetical protein